MWYILNEQNYACPVSISEYVAWTKNNDKHVGDTTTPHPARISTVFLGLDHALGKEYGPHLFETAVFYPANTFGQVYCERCCTYEQAVEMHERIVRDVFSGKIEVK